MMMFRFMSFNVILHLPNVCTEVPFYDIIICHSSLTRCFRRSAVFMMLFYVFLPLPAVFNEVPLLLL